ncbi:MAG TPA: tetratricopeptide repeat protein [Anaeromyxobacter sp.]|nr:tetratricopeptide repeat protein [Anaeromyxobacter sp.]
MAAAASWNVLLNGFVWDDGPNVLANPWVREPGRVWEAFTHDLAAYQPHLTSGYYRPLMHLVFAAVHAVAGLRPWAYHLVNLAAHAAAAACVYLILLRWSRPAPAPSASPAAAPLDVPWGPLVAALLFAVHPIHTQAVAWIAGIVDLSYSLLFLLAFLAATHERPGRVVPLVAAPALLFLALLAKEPAVALLPVVAVALALRGRLRDAAARRDALLRLGALALAVVAYLPLRLAALGGALPAPPRVHVGLASGVATALALAAEYLALLVAPVRLSALRAFEVVASPGDRRALAGVAAVAALAALVWALRRRPSAPLGAAILVLPLLPALYVPVLGPNAGAERYAYLPSAGAALILAAALEALRDRLRLRAPAARAALAGAAALAIVAGAAATLRQNAVWRDDLTLWTDAVAKVPASPDANQALGIALLAAGRAPEAIAALERAVALDPALPQARVNLASSLLAQGRADEALAVATDGARLLPRVAEAHGVLGAALAAKGRWADAAEAYERALALNPRVAAIHNGAAAAYLELGRSDLALAHLREAVRLEPENPLWARNLAWLASQ